MQFEEVGKPSADDEPEKDVGGRPQSLDCDDETLKQITGLARLQCTQKEAAAVLGVHRETFGKFLDRYPKAREAWEDGLETGKASLRRHQFKAAEAGNATMQIWLGKQWLDQTDKSYQEIAGAGGGPIQVNKVERVIVDPQNQDA